MPPSLKTDFRLRMAGLATLVLLCAPMTIRAEPPGFPSFSSTSVEAQFRGCDSGGGCRFWIEQADPPAKSIYRIVPDGIVRTSNNDSASIAVRDRLNALLANMIHQSKRIDLHDLRELADGTLAATITVNGVAIASDPILLDLKREYSGETR